jgi:hypothetical protein
MRARHPDISHHAPIRAAGSAMAVEPLAMVRGAPVGRRDGTDTQAPRFGCEVLAQV